MNKSKKNKIGSNLTSKNKTPLFLLKKRLPNNDISAIVHIDDKVIKLKISSLSQTKHLQLRNNNYSYFDL